LLVGEGLYPRRLPARLRRLARRLAGPERWGANALRIPWEAVVEVGADQIVVRA
jgi:sporulation protein YlmC with PRC-barrel domain